ncbi:MAG TPA: RNA methyltransferase [Gaiellaceae bacterium]|nr:RNA methyltransferase [Gaiellaceae bacterium]
MRRLARRGSPELCLAEGERAVRAAVGGGATIRELYVAPELVTRSELVEAAERRGADVVEIPAAVFSTLAGGRPDGLLAVVERPRTPLAALAPGAEPLVAVAVAIERPGNLGTIVRTACAVGAHALVVADPRTDLFHRDVVRGSVGAVFRLPCATASTSEALAWLRELGIRVVATAPSAPTPYWGVEYTGAVAVVLGGERHGLPAAWLDAADERVAIPMPGPVDSLNVAVAAGVVLCAAASSRLGGA